MNVVIVKYNAGNIQSVEFALKRLGVNATITGDAELIKKADKVIFPGVGEASTTMKYLVDNKLDVLIKNLKQPVLGICLGLQLMCQHSEENDTLCMNIFPEKVMRFIPSKINGNVLKVPHMGWNKITNTTSALLDTSLEGEYVYFVHSYYAEKGPDTAAITDYSLPFSSVLNRNNFYATQFHPEKSGVVGARILKNFIEL